MFDWFAGDLRSSLRSLAREPAFATAVVVILALGLGVNAAIFSFLDRVFLRSPAGVESPDELRRFWTVKFDKQGQLVANQMRVTSRQAAVLRTVLAPLGATVAASSVRGGVRLGDGAAAPTIKVMLASAEYLPLLGVTPSRGRLFGADEANPEAPAQVAVVSDALWRTHYGGDLSALGARLRIAGESFTIIGVAPPQFAGIDLDRVDVWVPARDIPLGLSGRAVSEFERTLFTLTARLSPGTRDGIVGEAATTLLRQSQVRGRRIDSLERVVTGSIIQARGPGKPAAEVAIGQRLGGVAVLVLLIACANVVDLLLAHAARRRREIAVRLALGSSVQRVIWLLAAPTTLLALMAGVVATVSAHVTGSVLQSLLLPNIHFAGSPLHWRLTGYTLLGSVVAGAVSAFVAGLQASRLDVTTFLKLGAQHGVVQRSRLRSVLLMVQAGLSVVLLVGSGLFLRSLWKIERIPLGYDVSRLTSVGFSEDESPALDATAVSRVAARIRLIPGVDAVAMSGIQPFQGGWRAQFYTATDSGVGNWMDRPSLNVVSPNYFAVTGLPIVRGRTFGDGQSWSVIINEMMARAYWPRQDPLGQCLRINKPDSRCFTVIGVSENAHLRGVIEEPQAQYYLPEAHPPAANMRALTILIRSAPARAPEVIRAARQVLLEAFPAAHPQIARLEDAVAPAYRPFRLGARLFSAMGVLALAVAMLGVYASVAYDTSQRTHEFGIRFALGASLGSVTTAGVRRALAPVGIGVVLGLAVAAASGKAIATFLHGVAPHDAWVMIVVPILVASVAVVAAAIPAQRAARIDPIIALRRD
jgi:predicted permease